MARAASYGTCQFNWKTGDLQPIFPDLINNHPADLQAAITVTADYNTFVDVVKNRTTAEQITWGDSITNQGNKNTVIEPWNTYFKTLGTMKSCQSAQETATQPYYTRRKHGQVTLVFGAGAAILFVLI